MIIGAKNVGVVNSSEKVGGEKQIWNTFQIGRFSFCLPTHSIVAFAIWKALHRNVFCQFYALNKLQDKWDKSYSGRCGKSMENVENEKYDKCAPFCFY